MRHLVLCRCCAVMRGVLVLPALVRLLNCVWCSVLPVLQECLNRVHVCAEDGALKHAGRCCLARLHQFVSTVVRSVRLVDGYWVV
jgi:hypothetical protein